MGLKIPDNLIHASFFFVDIVGLSSPDMSTNTQTSKIKFLNQCISECNSFTSISGDEKLILPTGDGMAIGFLSGLEHPLNLAIEIHKKLNEYNKTKVDTDKILVRIGCHSGNIFTVGSSLILALAILGAVVFRRSILKEAWLLLVIGIFIWAFTDTWYAYTEIFESFDNTHPTNTLWMASFMIIMYALYKHRKVI